MLKKIGAIVSFMFIITLVIPSVASATVYTHSRINSKIDTDLFNMFSSNPDQTGRMIVYLNQPTISERINYLLQAGIPYDHIEYAFKLIPAVIINTPYKQVNSLVKLSSVTHISMEHKIDFLSGVDDYSVPVNYTQDYLSPENITDVVNVWNEGYNGTGIKVAIVDTGIDVSHPDLSGKIIAFKDFVNTDSGTSPSDSYDDNGHGTACAWLVAGSGLENGKKYHGMAPGAKLISVKVLDSNGEGSDIDISKGIEYAWSQGADIISLSLGANYNISALNPFVMVVRSAIAHGSIVIAAAGNSGPLSMTMMSPGNLPESITVGATENDKMVAAFSSRGPVLIHNSSYYNMFTKPDIVAPGVLLLSARSHQAKMFEFPYANYSQYGPYYCWFSGTSAATPIVAGITALLLQKQNNLTQTETKAVLTAGANDLGFDAMIQGNGLVNASRSLELIDNLSTGLLVAEPIRYPTLPNGNLHIVVDKSFSPSNITLIATKSFHIDLSVSGNASEWLKLPVTSIDIHEGLNYLPISMNFNQEIPLDKIGNYLGMINISSSSKILDQIIIDFQIRSFGGRIGVDMYHQSALDPDNINSYSFFTKYLDDKGIIYYEDYDEISNTSLMNSDFYLIMDTENMYTPQEIDALHQFVNEGGILLIFSEFFNTTSHSASFGFSFYNEILEPYGISCEQYAIGNMPNGSIYGEEHIGAVDNDTLTQGVRNIYVLYGSTFHVDPSVSGAKGVIWADNAKAHAIVAYAYSGKGMVIAVSDGSTMYDTTLNAASEKGADNLALLHNIANMLKAKRPRIYDIAIEPGKLNQPNSISAYIFDDYPITSVTMYVIAPNGTEINLQVSQSLGYKYSSQLSFDRTGTWSIIVIVKDSQNQTRLFITRYVFYEYTLNPYVIEILVIFTGFFVMILILEIIKWRKRSILNRNYGPILIPA